MNVGSIWLNVVLCCLLPVLSAQAETAEVQKVVGESEVYTPIGFTPSLSALARYGDVSAFQVDRDGEVFDASAALFTRFRVGLNYDSGIVWEFFKLQLDYEHDLVRGIVTGAEQDLNGDYYPESGGYAAHSLKEAFAKASLGYFLTLGGGITTSQWGLGLLANDGNREWTPGSAYFGAPDGGDVVLRGFAATGPWTSQKIVFFGAYDEAQQDDVMLSGDSASQWVGGVKMGTGEAYEAGIYFVSRTQETSDGKETAVRVYDTYGAFDTSVGDDWTLRLALEGALIEGTTQLAPTVDFPEHDILQLAGAARVSLEGGAWGSVLDILYASGDTNLDDDSVNNFRVDVNYEMGMMLYRHVMAAQTARAPFHASDLNLMGVPNQDLDRIATRGSATNTLAFFPRLWYRPMAGLELYGGPLIALAEVPQPDPFNTRIAGGEVRNALDGIAGTFYGVEVDLGLRWTGIFWGTELQLGAEGGMFFPGSAFNGTDTTTMDDVSAWRVISAFKF